jgi:hypothetical protein
MPVCGVCHVAFFGALDAILLMWDQRVVTKVDVCLGNFVAVYSFRNVDMAWCGLLQGCMVRIGIIIEGFCGRNWQG